MHLRTAEVAARIHLAIEKREAFSLVRMADTEANLLWAAKGILPKAEGMNPHVDPDTYPKQTARLASGIGKADMIGLPFSGPNADKASFRPLLCAGINLYPETNLWAVPLCDCLVSYYLVIGGFFWGLLRDQRVLVMNDLPEPVAGAMLLGEYAEGVPKYNACAFRDVHTVAVDGPGIDRFVNLAANTADHWDVALVGAGARKMAIVPELAERTGKVVLDMGKVLARLIDPHPVWAKMADLYEAEG